MRVVENLEKANACNGRETRTSFSSFGNLLEAEP